MEKYGVVLAGGGAKGVYQIGAWRALRELEIPIGRVVGHLGGRNERRTDGSK